jgi:hypothetical protein
MVQLWLSQYASFEALTGSVCLNAQMLRLSLSKKQENLGRIEAQRLGRELRL